MSSSFAVFLNEPLWVSFWKVSQANAFREYDTQRRNWSQVLQTFRSALFNASCSVEKSSGTVTADELSCEYAQKLEVAEKTHIAAKTSILFTIYLIWILAKSNLYFAYSAASLFHILQNGRTNSKFRRPLLTDLVYACRGFFSGTGRYWINL